MGFSTSGRLRAWRFEDLDPEVYVRMFGGTIAGAKQHLAVLESRHRDPRWIADTLAALPVSSLAILGVLAECGGVLDEHELMATLKSRFGLEAALYPTAFGALLQKLLIVAVGHAGRSAAYALVMPSAELIAPRVRELDLPSPDEPFVPSDRLDDGRALLAACCALRHVDVKTTQQGLPHRAGIKRLAKLIGLDDATLDRLICLGQDLRLLETSEDGAPLRPSIERLMAAAHGRFAEPVVGAFCEQLRALAAPITLDRAERWCGDAARTAYGVAPRADQLASLPGIRRGRVGPQEALRGEPLDGAAAATITPSFEVFVPPEARHEHVVELLACAELVRIDRVIVGRITKASIQRAIAAGATGETIAASLAKACRTAIPANVASTIASWAGDTVSAAMAFGRVVAVPAAHEARVLAVLEGLPLVRLAPGVIVIDPEIDARTISSRLAKIDVHARAEAADSDDVDGPVVSPRSPDLPSLGDGDPALQQRLAAFRAGDPIERERVRASSAPDNSEDEDELGISPAAIAATERWERAHGALSDALATTVAALFDVLEEQDRKFLLGAKTARELDQRVTTVLVERGGMERFFDQHEGLFERMMPRELVETLRRKPSSSPVPREWMAANLYSYLEAAARTRASYALALRSGVERHVRIVRVAPRGSEIMVLGEDLRDNDARVAIPLRSIERIAELAPGAASATVDEPKRWRPLEGQQPPPGHVACPCGSGRKYRACCRETTESAARN